MGIFESIFGKKGLKEIERKSDVEVSACGIDKVIVRHMPSTQKRLTQKRRENNRSHAQKRTRAMRTCEFFWAFGAGGIKKCANDEGTTREATRGRQQEEATPPGCILSALFLWWIDQNI